MRQYGIYLKKSVHDAQSGSSQGMTDEIPGLFQVKFITKNKYVKHLYNVANVICNNYIII